MSESQPTPVLGDAILKTTAEAGIGFVICGMEHSGTTLISDLLRQVPGVDSGFEVGVLMAASPRDFPALQPFAQNMLAGWGITQEQFLHCCDTDTHPEFYRRLKKTSGAPIADATVMFDKTPRYIANLRNCMTRSPVPIIAAHKDPRAIVFSDFKRAKTEDFDGWYDDYMDPKRRYFAACYNSWKAYAKDPRMTSVALEALAFDARNTMERLFDHVGLTFRLEYALLSNLRFKNTRANFVSADIAFEYKKTLTAAQERQIRTDFGTFDRWFYD